MAKHNARNNATPRNTQPTAPVLVLGTSLAQALAAAPSTPAMPAQVPGALATPSVTLAKAVPAAAPVHPSQQLVKLGNPYNVRPGTQFDNVASWQATCAYLQANGGQCTVAQLAQHLKELRNHANFAGYCLRRGYLVPVAQPSA